MWPWGNAKELTGAQIQIWKNSLNKWSRLATRTCALKTLRNWCWEVSTNHGKAQRLCLELKNASAQRRTSFKDANQTLPRSISSWSRFRLNFSSFRTTWISKSETEIRSLLRWNGRASIILTKQRWEQLRCTFRTTNTKPTTAWLSRWLPPLKAISTTYIAKFSI